MLATVNDVPIAAVRRERAKFRGSSKQDIAPAFGFVTSLGVSGVSDGQRHRVD